MRIKGGPKTRQRHGKIIKATRGYRGTKHRLWKVAREAYLHAGEYAFAGRKQRKRQLRQLWTLHLNAALRPLGLNYSRFIYLLDQRQIKLNRKVLSELAQLYPDVFQQIVAKVKPL